MKKYIVFLLLLVPILVLSQTDAVEPTEDNTGTISQVINIVLTAVSIFFGSKFAIVKTKLSQARDLLDVASKALEDNNISTAEAKSIAELAKKFIGKS